MSEAYDGPYEGSLLQSERMEKLSDKLAYAGVDGRVDLKQQIEFRLGRAVAEVKKCEELLALLGKNPDVRRIMELMR